MTDNQLPFRISSGLKNIIGRDLITDDYVAVFELVKNSFDAYAQKVIITFEKDKMIIADDGKGMNHEDILKKWLFVAYSAKKEGVEDAELKDEKFKSYRDKIQTKKFFAGAKGIGRFSCDRLGSKLILTTKKAVPDSLIEQIEVNWNDFDKNPEDEFININVNHRTLTALPREFKDFKHGTIVEILNLNSGSTWNRRKKQELKFSLEKLINPFDFGQQKSFSIILRDESELERDKLEKNKRNRVNGQVNNFVFETLGLKTTQIITEIDAEGTYLTISLIDRGTTVYKIRKENPTEPKLSNIRFHLFHLNRIAKGNFTRLMGIEPVNFGSVFLYKNGVRIAPYGDVGFDYFGLDIRKAQGHFRKLGTRDLIGQIAILGSNTEFKEISSRDGGLVRNDHYKALVFCFFNHCLIRLEKYLSQVQWTSKEDKDKEDLSALDNIKAKSALLQLLEKEIRDEDTELLSIDKGNIDLRLKELLQEATDRDIETLKVIADKLGDKSFEKDTAAIEKEHKQILELQKKLKEEEEKKRKLEEQLILEKEKNTYLRTSDRSLSEDAKGLVHNIKITAKAIKSNVDTLYEKILNEKIKEQEILKRLGIIKFNAEKAEKISKIITRSNFKTEQNEQFVDLVNYIKQYIEIYSDIYEETDLEFNIINQNASLWKKVSLLDVAVVLDDLISNADKAKARNILIEMSNPTKNSMRLIISDDGKGVPKKFIEDPEQMFNLGVTTTDGSGIGLHSVRMALKSMNGAIKFLSNGVKLQGACFEIVFS